MSEEIKVHVVDYGRDRNLMLRYRDPITGKQVAKSAKTRNPSKALKAAGEWEDQLRSGRYEKPSRMARENFREYYTANPLPALASGTMLTYEATLNVFEKKCSPGKLSEVTTARVTGFVSLLRTDGAAEATIARHLRTLKAIMRWANREGLMNTLPKFTMPKRVKGSKVMRGRAVTGEEFDRMIDAVPRVVENAAAESWEFYLRGLWTSGLRLSESLTLRWEDGPDDIVVDQTGRRPMLRIPAEAEKGNKDRLLPMAPEFATLLQSVPEAERRGRVFKLLGLDGQPFSGGRCPVGKMITAIGNAAGVVVDERTRNGQLVRKFASAHDLRRAFGLRWAQRVMPAVLKDMMRHEDVSTTMKFYVGLDAEAMADTIWAAVGNTQGNTEQPSASSNAKTP